MEDAGRTEGAAARPGHGGEAEKMRGFGRLVRSAARIRSKLILLHTAFSLCLAVILLLALRAPIQDLVVATESREAGLVLAAHEDLSELGELASGSIDGIEVASGTAESLALTASMAEEARAAPMRIVLGENRVGWTVAARWNEGLHRFESVAVRSAASRSAVNRLYMILTLALLGVYAFIAIALEMFVLPKQVYEPIERLREADAAVQEGRREAELIPAEEIRNDELGDIMRSRNQSILKLRRQERELEIALARVEDVAAELKRKNHLLETAKRNLADQDRLASLGMMSAGIAHELNTPLAVLKGSLEQFAERPVDGTGERVELMLRVVERLERLSESLLDFARVRPPKMEPVRIRPVVEEAWTLVSIDREAREVKLALSIDEGLELHGDGDRLTQVLVNLLRNATDAMDGRGSIRVSANVTERDGQDWVSIVVRDSGPGIEPTLFPRLFEPFASTRMDAEGTGLGLAVAEGIIKEHGGILLARNAPPGEGGAVFEIMLPKSGMRSGSGSVSVAGGAFGAPARGKASEA